MTINPMGIACYTANSYAEAQEYLQSNSFDLCLTDLHLPDGDGLSIVDTIGQNYPQTPVAVITAYGNVETAVQALKAGAFDFIAKPLKVTELRKLVKTALQLPKLYHISSKKNGILPAQRVKQRENLLSKLIGQSDTMQKVRANIEKLARNQAPIYIKGESGTGKEVAARLIHALGARAKKPFIPVNCGAIPKELMESEFFGHKKGSFSGAVFDKQGFFQAAQGGTLFLDEIADLPVHMQVKLLRAIQEKQVRPVGTVKELPTDVRILSATHRDLAKLVKEGEFRKDLFYRINVIELYIPPLRARIEDIPGLVDKILNDLNSSEHKIKISKRAIAALQKYSFPGNVRELENILERAIVFCENNTIEVKNLQLPDEKKPTLDKQTKLDPLLNNVEKETILDALKQTRGNKRKAAKLLGIGLGALRYRLQKID